MARKKILIVDDDKDVRESLAIFLESKGFQTIGAEDGTRGLALAEREAPDLLIVDVMMPCQSGFALVDRIRRPQGLGPRVIFITGNNDPRHRRHAEEMGVDAFLCKPFDMSDLWAHVKDLMGADS